MKFSQVEAREVAIRELRTSGLSLKDVADRIGCSISTLYRFCTIKEIPSPNDQDARRRRRRPIIEEIVRMHDLGWNGVRIAAETGLRIWRVWYYLRLAGVVVRDSMKRLQEDSSAIVSAFQAGESQASLAARYRVSPSTVRRFLHLHGLKQPPGHRYPKKQEAAE